MKTFAPMQTVWEKARDARWVVGAAAKYLVSAGRGIQFMGLSRFLLIAWTMLIAVAEAGELTPGRLRIGFTKACFIGVNRNDAEAGFKVFLATVGRQRGYDVKSTVEIFDDLALFDKAIEQKELDLVIIDSWHFVNSRHADILEPAYSPVPKEKLGRTYAVLTRRGTGLDSLADLRGKGLVRLEMGAATMGRPWLDTLLMSQGLGTQEAYFGSVEVASKPTTTVLPVFFGQKPACLVDLIAFEVMQELNPQVGAALQIVVSSEPTVDNVICLAKDGWDSPAIRHDTQQALGELQLEPAGQQILSLFKINRLVTFEEKHLESVRKLRAAYDHLRKERSP